MMAVLTTSLPSIAADARLARLQWHFENRSRLEFRNYADFGLGADTHADFIRTRVGVEYRLTDLGQSLIVPFGTLIEWANKSIPKIEASRSDFDQVS